MSDQVGNQNVGFLTTRLICSLFQISMTVHQILVRMAAIAQTVSIDTHVHVQLVGLGKTVTAVSLGGLP